MPLQKVVAFHMDEWIKFKKDLLLFFEPSSLNRKVILDRICDLESYNATLIEQTSQKECTHCREEDPVFGMKYPCTCNNNH